MSGYQVKKIVVYGIGGVGGFFGGLLLHQNNDVTFIVREGTKRLYQRSGLRIESPTFEMKFEKISVTSDPQEVGIVDLIILAVKMHHLEQVIDNLKPMIGQDTVILPLQNGVEAHSLLQEKYQEHVIGGLCRVSSKKVFPGHIKSESSTGIITIGEIGKPVSERIQVIKDIFEKANITCQSTDDIIKAIWVKMIFGTSLHGVLSVTRSPLGEVLVLEETKELLYSAVEEITKLARSFDIDLKDTHADDTMHSFTQLAPTLTTSMQRDIMENQPSEIQFLTGTVVRLGKMKKIDTPLNNFIYASLLPMEVRARR